MVVTFVNDFTRITWVYLLKHKSDVGSVFRIFYQMVLTQFGNSLKIARSDKGGEYFKRELTDFFHEKGIIHQTSCLETPQQNGVAEWKNRQL